MQETATKKISPQLKWISHQTLVWSEVWIQWKQTEITTFSPCIIYCTKAIVLLVEVLLETPTSCDLYPKPWSTCTDVYLKDTYLGWGAAPTWPGGDVIMALKPVKLHLEPLLCFSWMCIIMLKQLCELQNVVIERLRILPATTFQMSHSYSGTSHEYVIGPYSCLVHSSALVSAFNTHIHAQRF